MKKGLLITLVMLLMVSGSAVAGSWSQPILWEHSSSDIDRMPYFDLESQTLYFVQTSYYDIYESKLVDGQWTAPSKVEIAGLNTKLNQVSPLRRGDHLYFAHYTAATDYQFYMSTWDEENQIWGQPELLETLSTPNSQDWALWVSSDETLAYLISKGPYGGVSPAVEGDRAVWKSEKVNGEWTTPVLVEGPINSEADEWSIFVDENSGIMYTNSTREGSNGYDIWSFDGEDGEAVNLGAPINAGGGARSMWTNGQLMFFTGVNYEGGIDQYDLFVSFWQD